MNEEIYFGILNGGKSKRMGIPKSLIKYKDIPLIKVVCDKAIKFSKNVCIIGSSPIDHVDSSYVILKDSFGIGPLKAVSSAYNYRKTNWFFWSVDLPLINDAIIEEMLQLRGDSNNSVIPYHNDIKKHESYFGYYSADLLQKIIPFIKSGAFSMQYILKQIGFIGNSQIAEKYKDQLKSWNTPKDIIQ